VNKIRQNKSIVFLFTLKERRNVVLAPMETASFFFFCGKKGKDIVDSGTGRLKIKNSEAPKK